ncbi:MAG: hypothetical protein LAT67_04570 [Balneolales bacterium]|nr:hypothetical protein [Balneolales bacterium]
MSYSVQIRVIDQNEAVRLPDSLRTMLISGKSTDEIKNRISRDVLSFLGSNGWLNANIDDISLRDSTLHLHITKGCAFTFGSLRFHLEDETNHDHFQPIQDKAKISTDRILRRERGLYTERRFSRVMDEYIRYWENEGYLFVKADLLTVFPESDSCRVNFEISVTPGNKVTAYEIIFPDLERNSPDFLERIVRIVPGDVLTPATLLDAVRRLENTGLFRAVEEPLLIQQNERFIVVFQVRERRTNAFDLLLGYVPQAQSVSVPGSGSSSSSGRFIGSGELIIRNLFLPGSRFDVRFERLQQFVTRLDLGYDAIYIGSTPFGAGFRFDFEQQNVDYQIRNIRSFIRYRLTTSTALIGSLRQETSAGSGDPRALRRVFDATTLFTGVGLEIRNTDSFENPTRGLVLNFLAESGIKNINDPALDEFTSQTRWSQQELNLSTRLFFSTFSRQVVSPSINAFLMLSPFFTESDLNRFGGARDLRGYREDQFQSARMLWADVEYRYLLDRFSYAFLFGAAGYYERPDFIFEVTERESGAALSGRTQWTTDRLYSYGLGFAYTIPLGVLQFSYALSAEDSFSNGKVHIGITANL